MYERLPPDLPRLRTIETYLVLALDEARKAIARAERVQAERAARRPLPQTPDWIIATGRRPSVPGATGPRTVHVGGCGMAHGTTEAVSSEQARRALAVDGIPACEFCRPDNILDTDP
ncbi:DUF6233 domain-containing protein [Streptomyces sp. NPDC052000]|uniref:DUF6233 domain-containing protein n=1 Tax=Streptomyces sp. NPDC052000 TaxID=3155676 RepID=UPI00344DB277